MLADIEISVWTIDPRAGRFWVVEQVQVLIGNFQNDP